MNRSLMAMKALRKHTAGFSLVEVMVVLVIIGIMAAIGMPAYQRYTYTARQQEAMVMLRDIWVAEKAEFMKTGVYKPMSAQGGASCTLAAADLSWSAENCATLKYQYTVYVNTAAVTAVAASPTVEAVDAAPIGGAFFAVAKANSRLYDKNTTANYDSWAMDESGRIFRLCDELKTCTAIGTPTFTSFTQAILGLVAVK